MTCAQWPCRGEDQSNEKKGMEKDTHHIDVSLKQGGEVTWK